MRKYLTWSEIGLHVLTVIVVSACFLFAGLHFRSALRGNALGCAYAIAGSLFGCYALYVWWKLIHERHKPIDKDWAMMARAEAEASGRPLHEIPGWALDRSLSKAVSEASLVTRVPLALSSGKRTEALESRDQKDVHAKLMDSRIAEARV